MSDRGPKNPSTTFFWNDWDNDEALKACSLAAQGLWMRMLCIAARSPEPGVVMIGGFPASRVDIAPRIAAVVGTPLEAVNALIDELLTSGAADLDRKKRIVNRRMVKAAALHRKRSEAGKFGADVTNGRKRENGSLPRQKAGKQRGQPPADDPAKGSPSSRLQDFDASKEDSAASAAGADAPPRAEVLPPEPDVKTAIFGAGLQWLRKACGDVSESSCRSFLGSLIADHGEISTATCLLAAERAKPVDPRGWMKRNIGGPNGQRPRNGQAEGTSLSPELAGIAAAIARRSLQPG